MLRPRARLWSAGPEPAAGRTNAAPALIAIGILLAAAVAAAPPARAQEGGIDPTADPLVLHRLDPKAKDVRVTIAPAGEQDEREVTGRMLLRGSQEVYLPSAPAALAFKAGRFWQSATRRLTFRLGERSFHATVDSRLVVAEGSEVLLPVPVLTIDGDVWLPIVFFTDVLGPGAGISVSWDPGSRRLAFGRKDYNVVGVRLEQLDRATAVHVLTTEPLSFRAEAIEPGHVALKIYRGEVDPLAVAGGPQGMVRSVQARQHPDHAMVHVLLDDQAGRFHAEARDEGLDIVLVLEEASVGGMPEPVPHGRLDLAFRDEPAVDLGPAIDVRKVAIDPGHGGVEVGKDGPGGLLEKDVNLAVALELRRLLEDEGIEVVLTREHDAQLSLVERTEIANRAGADLFLSLHCNGWFNDSARGLETYFLSPAKSEYSQAVAEAENAAGGNDDVAFIVWDLVQSKFITASSDLAEIVQTGIVEDTRAEDRGVRQAGFRVLVGAHMPAVLVEMGFLSNPDEARRLGDRRHQRALAAALAAAVVEFKERYARTATMAGEE